MDNPKTRDLYAALGLAGKSASQNEIRAAYVKLVLKLDPDRKFGRTSPGAIELTKKVNPSLLFASPAPSLTSSHVRHMIMVPSACYANVPSWLRLRALTTSLTTQKSALSTTRAVPTSATRWRTRPSALATQARIHPSTSSFQLREDSSNCRDRSGHGRDKPRHGRSCEHKHSCGRTRTGSHGYNGKYRRKDYGRWFGKLRFDQARSPRTSGNYFARFSRQPRRPINTRSGRRRRKKKLWPKKLQSRRPN